MQQFSDQLGPLDLWGASKQEIQERLENLWHISVAVQLKHRVGLRGLESVDVLATRAMLREYKPEAQSLLRVSLTGNFFTEKELHHIGEGNGTACPFCGQPDSIAHRIRSCVFFQGERAATLGQGGGDLGVLPPVQLEHAWAILPTGFQDLREALNCLPWYTHVDSLPALWDAQRHLFVDGSCLLPRNQHLRLASWSVVLGSISLQEVPTTLAAGTLPTIVQTSFRAEIFAFLIALRIVEASTGNFCIWTDCEGVMSRVVKFLDGAIHPSPVSSNCDLWKPLWQLVQLVRGRVQVRKVPAHDDRNRAEDVVHEWAVIQNDAADAAAKLANLNRSSDFWELWDTVRVRSGLMWKQDVRRRFLLFTQQLDTRPPGIRTPSKSAVFGLNKRHLRPWWCFELCQRLRLTKWFPDLVLLTSTASLSGCRILFLQAPQAAAGAGSRALGCSLDSCWGRTFSPQFTLRIVSVANEIRTLSRQLHRGRVGFASSSPDWHAPTVWYWTLRSDGHPVLPLGGSTSALHSLSQSSRGSPSWTILGQN